MKTGTKYLKNVFGLVGLVVNDNYRNINNYCCSGTTARIGTLDFGSKIYMRNNPWCNDKSIVVNVFFDRAMLQVSNFLSDWQTSG